MKLSLPLKQSTITAFATTVCAALLKPLKVSFAAGSQSVFFSYAQCITPLAGIYGGISAVIMTCLFRSLFDIFALSAVWSFALHAHLPTMAAGLYAAWMLGSNPTKVQRILLALIPVICFMLFAAHTNGFGALVYTTYWMIPLISALVPHTNRFIHALAATFTAHAVGSVIWLYAFAVPTTTLLNLIPVVAVERLLFASGIYLSIRAFEFIRVTYPAVCASLTRSTVNS